MYMWAAVGAGSTLDLQALCVAPGKTCWVLCIEALLLSVGGSVLDALSIAVRVCVGLSNLSTLLPVPVSLPE
jgi:exosome complex RNA-binding protein Rrp42 (RNase PH superfamily)